MAAQVQSRQRVIDHGEVLTDKREVNAMLDLVKRETQAKMGEEESSRRLTYCDQKQSARKLISLSVHTRPGKKL